MILAKLLHRDLSTIPKTAEKFSFGFEHYRNERGENDDQKMEINIENSPLYAYG